MSIADQDLRVQIDNRILRPYLDPDDAIYWLNRAQKLLPGARVQIIDLDGKREENSSASDEAAK